MNLPENQITAANDIVRVFDGFLSQDDFIRVHHWALSVDCNLTREERLFVHAVKQIVMHKVTYSSEPLSSGLPCRHSC